MKNSRDFFALDWIKGELDQTLSAARQALEDYAEERDKTRMRACLTHLHQVHGTLVMLELSGVAVLADEMERLAQALLNGEVANLEPAQQVLMQGILQLPAFLEEIQKGFPDSRRVVLPLANETRVARGDKPFADGPGGTVIDLRATAGEETLVRFKDIDGTEKARKIRAAYQQVLLAILRGDYGPQVVGTLTKVAVGLERICEHTPLAALWRAFGVFVKSLEGDTRLSSDVVKLLRRVDAEIKVLAQDGRKALSRPLSTELVRSLVDAAAGRGFVSRELDELGEALSFATGEEKGAASEKPSGIAGNEAMQSAATALREELASVKDQLDLFVRSEDQTVEQLRQLAAPLKRIGSTLSVLGFESSRAIVSDQVDEMNALAADGRIDETVLMSVASALLQVDENLAAVSQQRRRPLAGDGEPSALIDDAQLTVLNEARNGLEQVKQAVVEYVSAHWDKRRLADVPALLSAVRGALSMVALVKPAELLARSAVFVERELLGGGVPDWTTLDTFADAISGVDYYLERLCEHTSPGDDIVARVERSVTALETAALASRHEPAEVSTGNEDGAEIALLDDVAEAPPRTDAGDGAPEEVTHVPSHAAHAPVADDEAPFDLVLEETGSADDVLPRSADDAVEFDLSSELFDEAVGTPAPQAAPRQSAPPALHPVEPIDEPDQEIVEIFIEEIGEVLVTLDAALARWAADDGDKDALKEVRRAFHTLKGSGRIVGARLIGELSWSVENLLNRTLEGTLQAGPQMLSLAVEARNLMPTLRDAFQAREQYDESVVARFSERADLLASGGTLEELADEPAPAERAVPELDAEAAAEDSVFDDTKPLFAGELRQLLDVIESELSNEPAGEAMLRALHTLRGSASMAGVPAVDRLAAPLYGAARAAADAGIARDDELTLLLQRGAGLLRKALAAVERNDDPSADGVVALEAMGRHLVARLEAQNEAPAPLVALEGAGVLTEARDFLKAWHDGAMDLTILSEIVAALHEVRNQAESQKQHAVVDLCDALVGAHERLEDQPLPRAAHDALDAGHEMLLTCFDRIAAHQALPRHAEVVEALARIAAQEPDDESDVDLGLDDLPDEDQPSATVIDFPLATEPMDDEQLIEAAVPEELVRAPAAIHDVSDETDSDAALPEDVDPEILEIFFEESDELLETIDHSIHDWLAEKDNRVYLETLLRALHTLKGGARLAGLSSLGDETHAFESFLIQVQQRERLDDTFFRTLQSRHDELTIRVGRIKEAAGRDEREQRPAAAAQPQPVESKPVVPAPREAAAERAMPKAAPREVQAKPAPAVAHADNEPVAPGARTPADGREMVRVSAGLLEQLVNLAGETSIVRSRIEQGISDFAIALEEMETTIERVREQLRRLEIETETQVLFRHERTVAAAHYEEFDPLEMDRYSHLQQLSRALSESASDMLDLKETLAFKSREAETLLIQQARLNTELQEGLMRTRMVPFGRLVPRLRRIVRQVSTDLEKDVELHVYNPEGELDRNVLERMVPPLEHMLRNAIDHGIESPELRRNYGKPASGRIDLRLSREAGDVVIEIVDDGAGIDVESVRAKAIERGLMAKDAHLADDEVLQFVLASGFSTAKSVTQISGRGVGMDVVHATVKQLGGNIQIASVAGKGSRFTVRLPFTVSVNRALMVSVNEDLYAVPLNTIEGIVRISADQLAQMYAPNGGGFEYAGVPYRVRYLGSYIGREYKLRPEQGSVPVVLLRSGDIAMAIHVDGVAGSREIVVKSLGPQFAGVSGISGATILGDGSVVVILDLLALIRAQLPVHQLVPPPLAEKRDRPRCVMVVDDSVTVRKVTSRLLERQGMDVMVAKDGVEAIAMLQERRPDVLLLDIEMPRMDGFEVARQIRHDDRLAKLPIVMISSRTGAKHQEHAVELGVNRFLGKPFQESELLATIEDLVD